MALKSREAARMLEEVVGPDNFSEDVAIISSYTFVGLVPASLWAGSGGGKDMFDAVKMGAVILPGSREEVQAIIKICNRYKTPFKAISTGLATPLGVPIKEGSLQIDLRRMNRIVKLDDKNMYVVLEPYVSAIELHAEARKRGLSCHIIGGGGQHSVLASASSGWGEGPCSLTTSDNARNCLGEEWVLPTGEIVSWGLVDGKVGHPGPGYRGIYRGTAGVYGGLGVCTKIAVQLHHWPGPPEPEITGKHPTIGWKIPDNFRVYMLALPSPEKLADAIYKLVDAKIALYAWSYPIIYNIGKWMTDSNAEHYEIHKRIEAAGILSKNANPLAVIIAAYSEGELNYKQKVMKDIISEVGAEEFLAGFMTGDMVEKFLVAHTLQTKQAQRMRLGVGGGDPLICHHNFDDLMKTKEPTERLTKKYIDKGIVSDTSHSSLWTGPIEQRGMGQSQYVSFSTTETLDKVSPELIQGQIAFADEELDDHVQKKIYGDGSSAYMPAMIPRFSPLLDNFHIYIPKVKQALDPNDVGDPFMFNFKMP